MYNMVYYSGTHVAESTSMTNQDDDDWPAHHRGGKISRMKSRRLASRSRSRKFKTSRHKKTRRHTRRNRRKNRNK